jgi:hypothetical protein
MLGPPTSPTADPGGFNMRTPLAFLLAGAVLITACREEPIPDPVVDTPADAPADTLRDEPLAPGPVPVHPEAGGDPRTDPAG